MDTTKASEYRTLSFRFFSVCQYLSKISHDDFQTWICLAKWLEKDSLVLLMFILV